LSFLVLKKKKKRERERKLPVNTPEWSGASGRLKTLPVFLYPSL
jgi:hypothetical protein